MTEKKILLIGKSGRLDCLADALFSSQHSKTIHILSEVRSQGLLEKGDVIIGKTDNISFVESAAARIRPDFAVVGPEEPLAAGVVDALARLGIPSVGPTQSLARLESSKAFTRRLLDKYGIPGNPRYRIFDSTHGIVEYLTRLGRFVMKPDGLTGGKGVKVFGDHLTSVAEAFEYSKEIFDSGSQSIVVEECLDGEEFSLQSLFDGRNIVHAPPVQDHKRAWENDTGPNTGGMGSYSCADHSLPFLSHDQLAIAAEINRKVGEALFKETGQPYKGILYGGFMVTARGLRVIEYNARFGDPEIMNVLPLMEGDFVEVCEAIIEGRLNEINISFRQKATVCKYVVPEGYPNNSASDALIEFEEVKMMKEYGSTLRMFYAAVNDRNGKHYLTGSRALAFLGMGETVAEAEQLAETAARAVKGPVFHRADIGTAGLLEQRVRHMRQIVEAA